ncbi:hypothetical protein FKM82_026472 [Ascaphus truei]
MQRGGITYINTNTSRLHTVTGTYCICFNTNLNASYLYQASNTQHKQCHTLHTCTDLLLCGSYIICSTYTYIPLHTARETVHLYYCIVT